MSLALYPTRLYWDGTHGVAKLDGMAVLLTAAPELPGLDVVAIDYAPGVVAMVMPRFQAWRDMEAAEIEATCAFLRMTTLQCHDVGHRGAGGQRCN